MAKIYIVGTPIGNLQDITLRALSKLKQVDYIACEDTRLIRKILSHFEIGEKKLVVYNDQNKKHATKKIIALAKEGKTIAQVSDAGMPTISDPGYLLIKEALKAKIEIEAIPGVSAVTTTSLLANFGPHFSFHGFFNYKPYQRQKKLKSLKSGTHIFFLSPHRIKSELDDVLKICGADTEVFLGRELTKKFETHYRGTIQDVINSVPLKVKGELTIALKINEDK